eukprot:1832176-Pyramimonas_sp.AAC.1
MASLGALFRRHGQSWPVLGRRLRAVLCVVWPSVAVFGPPTGSLLRTPWYIFLRKDSLLRTPY